jgi:hypothetical protein
MARRESTRRQRLNSIVTVSANLACGNGADERIASVIDASFNTLVHQTPEGSCLTLYWQRWARLALIRTPLERRRRRSLQLPGKEAPPLAKVINHLRLLERLEVAPPVLSATPVGCGTPTNPPATAILGDTGFNVTTSWSQN